MKSSFTSFIIGLCFILLSMGCDEKQEKPSMYITSFDVSKMMELYFPKYEYFGGGTDYSTRYYKYQNNADTVKKGEYIFFSFAILPTSDEAYNNVLEMFKLKEVSVKYQLVKDMPGDYFWGTYNGDTLINTTCVITIENLMISMGSLPPGNYNMIELAEKIDKDFKNETCEYFTIDDKLLLPEIRNVSSESNSVKKGEEVKLTIEASDPKGEKIGFYFSEPGFNKSPSDKANEYIFKPSEYSQKLNGKYTFKVRVMNEKNVFSKPYVVSIKSDD
jgi:hypothetical protein